VRALIITPAEPGSLSGNRVTAERWGQLLEELGHDVCIDTEWRGEAADLLVALHARKSHASVVRFSERFPAVPIVVVLTGTDVYDDLHKSAEVLDSMRRARCLVALQKLAERKLPSELRKRVRVIHQSAEPAIEGSTFENDTFDVCVLAHLRPVKDPLLAALATRQLPRDSKLRVLHAGQALDAELESAARAKSESNPRYEWLGPLSRLEARRLLASSRALLVCSRSEGGANVVSEAVVCGVPVLSTRIDGSLGLLGETYPGFFEVGDASGLAKQLQRIEEAEGYLGELRQQCERLAPLFTREAERAAWAELLQEVGSS
jgi:putative glycosyltransferase (TIGR04348 family)